MVDGYLFDTNHVTYWFDRSVNIMARIASLPKEAPLRVSVVTMGEIEYGHRASSPAGPTDVQLRFSQFVSANLPNILPITTSTAVYYGDIRARLFAKFSAKKKQKALRPEQLLNPLTSKALGIQENDLWIAAQALEHDLVLVTNDAMHQIHEAVKELRMENWQ